MTRVQLKTKAKSQINNNILILFLCHAIVYIVSNLNFIAEIAARAFYYPTRLSGMWFQTTTQPMIRNLMGVFKGMCDSGYVVGYADTYFRTSIYPTFAQPSYPVGIILLIALLSIISFIITPAFTLGIHNLYLNLAKGEKPSVDGFLNGVTSLFKAFILQILLYVFTFLWFLLFIIPGIIKSISYSMSFFILAENPEMDPLEAISESKRLMHGHKMDYFILEFSFFWWYLLAFFTCGIAYIYVYPYFNATMANFYREIKYGSDSRSRSDLETVESEILEDYSDGFEEQ